MSYEKFGNITLKVRKTSHELLRTFFYLPSFQISHFSFFSLSFGKNSNFYFVLPMKSRTFAEKCCNMAKHPLWKDEYWLLLLQLYQKKPMGVKPLYSKGMVNLALELHIAPEVLHEQMFKLRMVTPRIKRLWDKYGDNPKKLARDIHLLKKMEGCGNATQFYQGVSIRESFEHDWEPIEAEPSLTPVKLIIILDLYFQLTPITMVPETPEIIDLAKLIKTSTKVIVEAMNVFQICDPYLNRNDVVISHLIDPCSKIWQRYGNGNPDKLYKLALELKEYFK